MPRPAGHLERDPREHDHGLLIQDRAPLSFVNEQHAIVIETSMHRHLCPGQQRVGAGRKRGPGDAWIDDHDDLTGNRRSQLQHFPLLRYT